MCVCVYAWMRALDVWVYVYWHHGMYMHAVIPVNILLGELASSHAAWVRGYQESVLQLELLLLYV